MGTRTSQAVVENIRWVERHSVELRSLAETDVLRKVLAQFGQRLDGELAAASTVSRKRATLFNVVGYAVEKTDYFEVDPLLTISWTAPPNTVDRRRVVNEANGRLLRLHLREFGTALDGRLFQAENVGLVDNNTYLRIWTAAREEVLTKRELGRHRTPVPDPSRDVADRVNRSGRS